MGDWQDVLLVVIFVLNGIVAAQAIRVYRVQENRIDNLNKQIDELKDASFGTIEQVISPIKLYIDLLKSIMKDNNELLKDDSMAKKTQAILDQSIKNGEGIEILLKTRLSNSEALSYATRYPDDSA